MLNAAYWPLFQQTCQWLEKELLHSLQDPHHYRLLNQALGKIKREFTQDKLCPAVVGPSLVYATLDKEPDEALAILTAAHVAFYMFLDLTDDVEDHDLNDPLWQELGPELALNTGSSFLFLSQILLEHLGSVQVSERHIADLRKHFMAAGWTLTAGQHRDLYSRHQPPVSLVEAWRTTALKSGCSVALYFATAALVAGASPELQQQLGQLGNALGQFLQARGDYHDLLETPMGSDLRNGYQTVPLALCYEHLSSADRMTMLVARQMAATDPAAHAIMRHLLSKSETARHLNAILEQRRTDMLTLLAQLSEQYACEPSELQFFIARAQPLPIP